MPMRLDKFRLVHLLTLFVSLAMLSLSVLQIAASWLEARKSLYDTTLKLNHESSMKMGLTMGAVFRSMKNALRGNAKHIAEQTELGGDPQPHVDHFMESNNFFNGIVVADSAGNVLAASENLAGAEGAGLAEAAGLTLSDYREPAISAPFRSPDGKLVVLMTWPIHDEDGGYLGWIGGTIHLAEPNVLHEIFGAGPSGESGTYIYVVDPSGNILYHPDPDRLGDSEASNPVVRKLMNGGQGCEKVRNTRGDVFLAGYSAVSENGWGIVVQTPVGEIDGQVRDVVLREIGFALPYFVLLLGVTIWIAEKIAEPFSVLAERADRLVEGYRAEESPKPVFLTREANQFHLTVMLAMDRLMKQAEHFMHESLTDPLTGLANRRTMDRWIEEWIRVRKPFAVILLDIDHFKRINDTYGHQVGDEVLRFTARIMADQLRKGDCCCRYGGEEFAVLLPETSAAEAEGIAERIRSKLEREVSPAGEPVTVSCGVAAWPDDARTAHDLLEAADSALYEAKRAGRNRTVVSGHL